LGKREILCSARTEGIILSPCSSTLTNNNQWNLCPTGCRR